MPICIQILYSGKQLLGGLQNIFPLQFYEEECSKRSIWENLYCVVAAIFQKPNKVTTIDVHLNRLSISFHTNRKAPSLLDHTFRRILSLSRAVLTLWEYTSRHWQFQ